MPRLETSLVGLAFVIGGYLFLRWHRRQRRTSSDAIWVSIVGGGFIVFGLAATVLGVLGELGVLAS